MEYSSLILRNYRIRLIKTKSKKLNKIMGAAVDEREVLSNDNEETNNVQLEEKKYIRR